jgi:putative hydrolase of the HAD superfamily
MKTRVLLWDFDGTLAERPGRWSRCLCEAAAEGDGDFVPSDFRPYLDAGFPWHTPDVPHPDLEDGEAWWERVTRIFSDAYVGVGINPDRAHVLARRVRDRYLDDSCWRVFEDALPVLSSLGESGWRHVILSNHVPELPVLVEKLGLAPHIDAVLSSAAIGYEKPHPEAFRLAREAAGRPSELWMIGDNATADVAGAEAVGIPAILVRGQEPTLRCAPDLYGITVWLERTGI